MSHWTDRELQTIDHTDELRISSSRRDGTVTRPVTIWAVRVGDQVYVRSVHGRSAGWFTSTQATGTGHVSIGGIEKDVTFAEVSSSAEQSAISQAYRVKYGRYAQAIVGSTLTPDALAATIEATPR
jgi:hypothetical protein